MNIVQSKTSRQGFTLLEMLVAMTVAAILTTVSLNVYSMFHHGFVETSVHYEQFVSEKVKELRCRTRFVRGLPPCDTTPDEFRTFRASRETIRLRF
ncbi:prepilin-type N-terminal cleavage/methylation domain-containing protein [Fibrobacter sp.]|uniref:prepilin-type N-terminal cleavage/methylation domain-containing protein n=1 Tax=Fibrobacter sp. TaxID=35828 RepID=UPI0038698F36